jgi:hypothetical protein
MFFEILMTLMLLMITNLLLFIFICDNLFYQCNLRSIQLNFLKIGIRIAGIKMLTYPKDCI